jgi:NADP-dependent 3-hydroxy acid dehydrogenase YdfG
MAESARQDLNDSGVRVTLLSPGMVETPFWDAGAPGQQPLTSDDVADAVLYAVTRPRHVDVNEILLRPTEQPV